MFFYLLLCGSLSSIGACGVNVDFISEKWMTRILVKVVELALDVFERAKRISSILISVVRINVIG